MAAAAQAQIAVNPEPFGVWIEELKAEALARGLDSAMLDAVLINVAPLPRVIELDNAQPENTLTEEEYLRRMVTPEKIRKAQAAYRENYALLWQVSERYGVEPQYIVALWGIESNFGERQGRFNVIEALVTLAYDGRRSAYFRGELLNALTIIQQERLNPEEMRGSWAGAMGQSQFMPSSFLRYAVDFDGDGRRDIWHSRADAFASIANYLASEGWNQHTDHTSVLLKWNRSRYFATAVTMLANGIARGSQ